MCVLLRASGVSCVDREQFEQRHQAIPPVGSSSTLLLPPAHKPPSPQVSRRCYQLLLVHMTRFTYSPTGALKWKKDVSEYAEVLSSYGVPSAQEDLAYLQQVCLVGWLVGVMGLVG